MLAEVLLGEPVMSGEPVAVTPTAVMSLPLSSWHRLVIGRPSAPMAGSGDGGTGAGRTGSDPQPPASSTAETATNQLSRTRTSLASRRRCTGAIVRGPAGGRTRSGAPTGTAAGPPPHHHVTCTLPAR